MDRVRAGARSIEAQLHSQIIGSVVQLLYLHNKTPGAALDIETGVHLVVSAEGVEVLDDGIQHDD